MSGTYKDLKLKINDFLLSGNINNDEITISKRNILYSLF